MRASACPYVSRAGIKLAAALDAFGVDPRGLVCADLGCNVGGFTDCLLQRGAARIYAIDTGYGVLDYRLRRNERIVVMERTNALHARLPEPVDLAVIDLGWTRQRFAAPAAAAMLKPGGRIISLVKPQYEARPEQRHKGVVRADAAAAVLRETIEDLAQRGLPVARWIDSPIAGRGGNREYLILIEPIPGRTSSVRSPREP